MKNTVKHNRILIASVLRKNVVSLITLICSVMLVITGTFAWLTRSNQGSEAMKTGGFTYERKGIISPKLYKVRTYYRSQSGAWILITTDYVREEAEWADKWDEMSAILVPGKRTEFKTEIINLTGKEQHATVFLKDVAVETPIRENVKIGVSDPEVVIYECGEDSDVFTQTVSDEESEWTKKDLLPIAVNASVPANGTLEVDWYLVLDSEVEIGGFPILQDKTTGEPIQSPDGCYYSVNKTDSDGNVTEAFLCDQNGVLIVSGGQLTEYPGDYAQTRADYCLTGISQNRVRISGMYITAG